jgi:tetratricopeptide (TPR) repeat protein
MALVNVAIEMVKSGLRVLVVDFDLEAPGLDTFKLPRPQTPTKGVVDFVKEYLDTGESANVSEFVYKSALANVSGELWVMPAGKSGEEYDRQFKSIDWGDLYKNHDGYLLFEDLKAQWDQTVKADYVLIDSRTGHTDVSGICTRQLPNTVALFFFPNEQNRRGLETVTSQIRAESETSRKKNIKLHFVMSNVPELDDEEGFLADNVIKLKSSLRFNEPSAVIHHYLSLVLLTQSVFTLDKPKTRLAQEYGELADTLRRDNLEDREVALGFLEGMLTPARVRPIPASELEQRIYQIQSKFNEDAEILFRLAILLRRQRRFEEALALLEQVSRLGTDSAEFYLVKAELYSIMGESSAALLSIRQLLKTTDATYLEISAAARLLLQRNPDALGEIVQSSAFERLDHEGQFFVAGELQGMRQGMGVAAIIYQGLIRNVELTPELRRAVRINLTCALLNQGQYAAASDLIISNEGELYSLEIEDCFNYAMAQWGLKSYPSPELFHRVTELDKEDPQTDPNGHQCLSIALWAIGDTDKALMRLGEAWQQIARRPTAEFSCWSYLRLTHDQFLDDLREIRQVFEGHSLEPRFIRDNKTATDQFT